MANTNSYSLLSDIVSRIPAKDVLQRKSGNLHGIAPNASVYEAVEMMEAFQIGALLVIEKGSLVGIVTERDYARKVILMGRLSRDTPVAQIMTSKLFTISPETSLQECMRLMTTQRIRHLPVLVGLDVVGILSIGDIVRATLDHQNQALDELQRYVASEPTLRVQTTVKSA